jgi:hypothetical protein
MLPKQAIRFGQLIKEGLSGPQIKNLSASLDLFPTPFKGIYYVPSPEEKKAWFIDRPNLALKKALQLYLATGDFYFSCTTAEEFFGLKWTPSGEIHIVNTKHSGRIDLAERIRRNERKETFRAKKIAAILSYYGNRIIFHKVKSIKGAKFKETPYGRFALRSQIKKDRKRFRETRLSSPD